MKNHRMYKQSKVLLRVPPTLFPLLLIHIICLLPAVANAQSTITVGLDTTAELAIRALGIPEIRDYAQTSGTLIRQVNDLLEEEVNLSETMSNFEEVDSQIEEQLNALRDSSFVYSLDRFDRINRELDLSEEQLNEWEASTGDWSQSAQLLNMQMDTAIQIWQLTLDSTQSNQIQPSEDTTLNNENSVIQTELINTINSNLSNLIQSQQLLDSTALIVINKESKLTIAFNNLQLARSELEEKQAAVTDRIWVPEYPPIWKMNEMTQPDIDLAQYVQDTTDANQKSISRFFEGNSKLIYYTLFTLLFLIGLLVYLRKQSDRYYAHFQEELKEANILLQYPVLTAFILTCFLATFNNDLPKEVEKIIALLILFPLSYLLWLIKEKSNLGRILFFAGAYLLYLLIPELSYFPKTQRYLLLAVELICVWLLYQNQDGAVFKTEKFWSKMIPYLIRFFLLISVIALVANVLGMLQLAQLLTSTVLGSFVYFVVLMEITFLIRSIIFLLLLGPFYQNSNILKEDSQVILEKIDDILKTIVLILWVIITLELLKVRESFFTELSNFLNRSIAIGEISFTLGNILAFFIILQISIWLSKFVRYFLDMEVFPRGDLEEDTTSTISLMVRYAITIIGFFLALAAAGVQLDQLSVALGGLGVGIGFGLQDIVNNFVSGIILALERPFSIGDSVEIGEVSGTVQEIGFRASQIRGWDGSEVIIPNGDLLSASLTNWTYTDNHRRITVEVRVPFDSDMNEVKTIMIDTAAGLPEVMEKPGPYVNLKGIGESAMEINLYCWIPDTNTSFSSGTAIRTAVFNALQAAGYDIPVPKTDVQVQKAADQE